MVIEFLKSKATVFAALNYNPLFCNFRSCSCKRRISSAKRISSKDGMLSPRSKPHVFVSAFRHIPHCNPLQKKRGLNTHRCRFPAWRGRGSLLLCSRCIVPIDSNKSRAKSKRDGQRCYGHVRQGTMHSTSPCQIQTHNPYWNSFVPRFIQE